MKMMIYIIIGLIFGVSYQKNPAMALGFAGIGFLVLIMYKRKKKRKFYGGRGFYHGTPQQSNNDMIKTIMMVSMFQEFMTPTKNDSIHIKKRENEEHKKIDAFTRDIRNILKGDL